MAVFREGTRPNQKPVMDAIVKRLQELEMSKADLARKADISRNYLYDVLGNREGISVERLGDVIRHIGLKVTVVPKRKPKK